MFAKNFYQPQLLLNIYSFLKRQLGHLLIYKQYINFSIEIYIYLKINLYRIINKMQVIQVAFQILLGKNV